MDKLRLRSSSIRLLFGDLEFQGAQSEDLLIPTTQVEQAVKGRGELAVQVGALDAEANLGRLVVRCAVQGACAECGEFSFDAVDCGVEALL